MAYFIGLLFAAAVLYLIKEHKERKEAREAVDQYFAVVNASREEPVSDDCAGETASLPEGGERRPGDVPDTMGLMKNALMELGCQPEMNNDGSMRVAYQGENFQMEFAGVYARIWDPFWCQFRADDPNWPHLCEAINSTNYSFGPTIVYTAPNDEGMIGLHSRIDILLHPTLPETSHYVRSILDSFFATKERARSKFQSLAMPRQEPLSGRRPVGFSASPEDPT